VVLHVEIGVHLVRHRQPAILRHARHRVALGRTRHLEPRVTERLDVLPHRRARHAQLVRERRPVHRPVAERAHDGAARIGHAVGFSVGG